MKQIYICTIFVFFGVIVQSYSQSNTTKESENTSHSEDGLKLYNSHDYKGAIVEFTKALNENKNDGKAFYYRGMAKMHDSQKGYCKDLEKSLQLGYVTSADIYYYGCDTHK